MNPALLSHALTLFGSDDNQAVRLSGGTSSAVYEFTQSGKQAVLRLTPPGEGFNLPAMTSSLDWVQYLAKNGLSVPLPLPSIHNRLVETIPDGDELWLVTAVQKARGVRAETLGFEEWNDRQFTLLGSLTGKLHRLSQGYQPPAGIVTRPAWDEVINNYSPLDKLAGAESGILQLREEVIRCINSLPRTSNTYGLIHSDLQCANFFIDTTDDTLTLYDFDDCCYGWYLMDIALPLLDLLVLYPGHDRQAFATRFLDHFLDGYRSERLLDQDQLNELPAFLKLLEIGLYLQVADFADKEAPDSWVGKFIQGRKDNILSGKPFVPLSIS